MFFSLILPGTTCAEYGLPDVSTNSLLEPHIDITAELETAQSSLAMLNPEQRALVETIFRDVSEVQQEFPPKCRTYFLDGPGGSGKTMVYNTLCSALRARRIKVCSFT